MSYEIVYCRQFLKIDEKIIPLVLYGSNNCYEIMWNGRERRERSWHPMYFGRNTMIAQTEKDIMERVKSYCTGINQEHFMKNGKWVNDKMLIRFFQSGIKNAKTIEELKEIYFFGGMHGYFSVWNRMENKVENRTEISSSDDLRNFLVAAQDRLDNRAEKEEVFICLKYCNEEFVPKVKKERKPKERLNDYYAIKVDGSSYLSKLTKRRIRCYSLCDKTKQFKTEKEANKYVEKLLERFNCRFEVEHIVTT